MVLNAHGTDVSSGLAQGTVRMETTVVSNEGNGGSVA